MLVLPFTAHSFSVLSTITDKEIQGVAPQLKPASQENRLGFTVGGKFYSESSTDTETTEKIGSDTPKLFDKNLTFNDFAIKTLTADDFSVLEDYDDSNGDIAKISGAFTATTSTYIWTDNSGHEIPSGSYGNIIGCGSGYSMPLTLEIKTDVVVSSEYGDPRESAPTTLTKKYQIESTRDLCFAKPNSMDWIGIDASGVRTSWNDPINTTRHNLNGGGYDSTVFDPKWGFKASASPAFPTTGFPGAQFQLIVTGAQTDWQYEVTANPGNGVTVDGEGKVLLNSKPTGEVTVKATLVRDSAASYEYKFTPTTNGWFVPKLGTYNYTNAKNACGGEEKIPIRADLTNSPRNTVSQGWEWVSNYSTRAIGRGVFSEWGWTDTTRYSLSLWGNVSHSDSYYRTKDIRSSGQRFKVLSRFGHVTYDWDTTGLYVVCLD